MLGQLSAPEVLFALMTLGLIGLSMACWFSILVLAARGEWRWPQIEPREWGRWGLVDLLMAVLVMLTIQLVVEGIQISMRTARPTATTQATPSLPAPSELGLALMHRAIEPIAPSSAPQWQQAAQELAPPKPAPIEVTPQAPPEGDESGEPLDLWSLLPVTLSRVLAVFAITFFVAARCRRGWEHLGWSTQYLAHDLMLGLAAYVLLAPPTLLLLAVLSQLVKVPYEHPVIETVLKQPDQLLPAIFMAALVAPLLEEFLFRVLLQGWLQSLATRGFSWRRALVGRAATPEHDSDRYPTVASTAPSGVALDGTVQRASDGLIAGASTNADPAALPPYWPAIVTGLVFGALHFDYGVSWLPLCLLGIGLGFLYRWTNRIWPSLVVHCLLNGSTMTGLTLKVVFGDGSTP